MSYPSSYPGPHSQHGEPSEILSATVFGLALMVITTTWWWYVMR